MKPKMIFHHPLPINSNGKSGSQVRPYKMVEAFKNMGYKVRLLHNSKNAFKKGS